MDKIIAKDFLEEFSDIFLGYGNIETPIWFIGMEPGAPREIAKVEEFFKVWVNRGKPAVDDLRDSHLQIRDKHYQDLFSLKVKYQRTWGGLIKLLFNYYGKPEYTTDEVKSFQSDKLGRFDSDHCLLELLPIPSPDNTSKSWEAFYGEYIGTRQHYEEETLKHRVSKFGNLIQEYKPSVIVFYGKKYIKAWQIITGGKFMEKATSSGKTVLYKVVEGTVFVVISHPSSRGISNNYLADAARIIKTKNFIKE